MRSARRRFGDFGERLAADHLRERGYAIVERNWRCQYGEIDLVAHLGDQIIFVEVRARRGSEFPPEASLSVAKQRRLIRLAYRYLEEIAGNLEQDWRIDLIAISLDGAGRLVQLNHIEGAVVEE